MKWPLLSLLFSLGLWAQDLGTVEISGEADAAPTEKITFPRIIAR